MSDYNIDDILAEIDRKRDGDKPSAHTESVTEIIGGNELEQAMRRSGAKPRRTEEELYSEEQEEQLAAQRRAEEIARAAQYAKEKKQQEKQAEAQRRKEKQEREKAEAEAMRRAREEKKAAAAAEKKRLEEEARAIEAEKRRLEEQERAAREAMLAEADAEIEEAAGELAEEIADERYANTAEITTHEEAAAMFASTAEMGIAKENLKYVEPESEYVQPFVKPEVSGDDDDIIFHTRGDLVTTETQQIRKQQRIEEINRALLEADMSAESPEDLLDSINPMDSRAKAAEEIKNAETVSGDTLAVAGNDLKRLSSGEEEHVKEYAPVTSRRKSDGESRIDSVLRSAVPAADDDVKEFATAKQRRSNEALVASLNKKLKEQREREKEAERTVTLTDLSDPAKLPPHALNIDYEKQLVDTSILHTTDPVAAVREADELAARKKRKISSFMLEDIDDEVDSAGEEDDDYDEEEEVIDLDDENVIIDRLTRAGKGLMGRLVILAGFMLIAIVAGVIFRLNAEGIPILSGLCNKFHVENYLYTNLVIGILSFAACSSVVTNGLSRLIKLRPDGDTLCAFAHIGAIGAMIAYLAKPSMLVTDNVHLYLIVSLGCLCFNTVSKLCTVKAAQRNFAFVSGDRSKYFVECLSDEGADKLAKGTGTGIPVVASMRKTELLCDFIISTYCEDVSDRISKFITPAVLVAAIGGGLMTFFMSVSNYPMDNLALAVNTASAVLAVGATFTGTLTVMLPMLSASRSLVGNGAAVLGYSAVEEVSETSAVLVEAKSLFPVNSIKVSIWDYTKNGSKGTQHIQIDEAIIYAASLALSSDSVLADAFFNMLNYKSALLKKVSNCVYESNLGVMGWIGSRRVLLGNRDHMKSHGVAVPEMKKVTAVNKNNNEVVYLAVGGELCMVFLVDLTANTQIKQHVNLLAKNGVSLVIKTVDGMITDGVIGELFEIPSECVRIIPYEAHDEFDERTKYISKGSAAVSCDGSFSSFATAVNGSKSLYKKIKLGCAMQIAGVALGILLVLIFAFFGNYNIADRVNENSTLSPYFSNTGFNFFDMLNAFYISIYNLAWLVLTVIVQAFKRIKI